MNRKGPASRRSWFVVAVLLFGVTSAAARTEFVPYVGLATGYNSNVQYAGVQNQSDTVSTLQVAIPVNRDWPSGNLRFSYRPSYVKYRTRTDLDRAEHRLNFDLGTGGERGRFTLLASFTRTQSQTRFRLPDDPLTVEDTDPFLSERTWRNNYGTSLRYEGRPSQRWTWFVSGRWGARKHEEIAGFTGPPNTRVEDRVGYGGTAGFDKNVSRASRLGLELEYYEFDLEFSGKQQTSVISVDFEHDFSRKLTTGFSVGLYQNSGEAAGVNRTEGLYARFFLDRAYETWALRAGIVHRPTGGAHLIGTSINTEATVRASGRHPNRWEWATYARAGRREPPDNQQDVATLFGFGAEVEREFLNWMGLRLAAGRINQNNESPVTQDIKNTKVGIAVVFYPNGRAALRGGVRR